MTTESLTADLTTWTYEGYWAVVLGDDRTALDVVQEFALVAEGLDEWLGTAEAEAWAQGGLGADMPEEWGDFHARALAELRSGGSEMPRSMAAR